MDHTDHVTLLRDGIPPGSTTWADFGCGAGAFTLALAHLLGSGAHIIGVDRDERALGRMQHAMRDRFPAARVEAHNADFTQPLDLPPLDGLVMANSLHFQRDQTAVVDLLAGYLKPDGRFLIVEYNIHRSRPWVPYPVPFSRWKQLAQRFEHTQKLGTRPSRTTREIYSAASWSP